MAAQWTGANQDPSGRLEDHPEPLSRGSADPMLNPATISEAKQSGYYGPRFNLLGAPAPAKVSARGRDEQVATRR
ncbi:hypothetical protein [Kineosporia babensis]|uniref:Uncharacterized protein n=1 Tax=Kineosporia babensis TaxID=499548 RepID=A0A9X1NIS2_9ACTN|nr:hypothetical protein [Kineosporia babensis]MCD5313986.1 hypothetical protein [Kineosporia babensis]